MAQDRLGTNAPGSNLADTFVKANPGSVYHSLHLEKLKDSVDSFVLALQGVQLVVNKERYAYINDETSSKAIAKSLGIDCQVCHLKMKIPNQDLYLRLDCLLDNVRLES